jgi:hypothetical protein
VVSTSSSSTPVAKSSTAAKAGTQFAADEKGKHDCKGQNDCKGQGFKALSAKACKTAGGSLTAPN